MIARMIITITVMIVWVCVNTDHLLLGEAMMFMFTVILVSDFFCWIIPIGIRNPSRCIVDKIYWLEDLDGRGFLSTGQGIGTKAVKKGESNEEGK